MQNNNTKKKLKTLAMVMALSIPIAATAQGGLFQRGEEPLRSDEAAALTNQAFGGTDGGITNQTFGAPLDSGLLVLLAVGAGYATLKRKTTNQINSIKNEKN